MKLKRILSVLLTVIVSSSMAVVVYADSKPNIDVKVDTYEAVAGNAVYDVVGDLGLEGNQGAYLLTFTASDIALKRAYAGDNTRLMSYTAKYTSNDVSNITTIFSVESVSALACGAEGTTVKFDMSGSGIYPTKVQTITADQSTDVLATAVVMVNDKTIPVTLTPDKTENTGSWIVTGTWSGATYKGDASKVYYQGTGLDMETLVLGKASSPITTKNETVGTYNGKTLKLIAEVLDTVDASKKVAIVKNGTERQESGRTLAQIVNGVAVGGNSITGKLAVGVLTTDVDAVFTFELY